MDAFGTFAASVMALLTALYLLRQALDGQARHLYGLHSDLEAPVTESSARRQSSMSGCTIRATWSRRWGRRCGPA